MEGNCLFGAKLSGWDRPSPYDCEECKAKLSSTSQVSIFKHVHAILWHWDVGRERNTKKPNKGLLRQLKFF